MFFFCRIIWKKIVKKCLFLSTSTSRLLLSFKYLLANFFFSEWLPLPTRSNGTKEEDEVFAIGSKMMDDRTHSLSLAHTHTHFPLHAHTRKHTLSLFLKHTYIHTLSLAGTQTYTLSPTHTHTYTFTHTHSFSLSLYLWHRHTHTHSVDSIRKAVQRM